VAGKPGCGGQNRLSLAVHLARNTFQPSRHGHLVDQIARPTSASPSAVSSAQKRAALCGLDGVAAVWRIHYSQATGWGWSRDSNTLRSYALSCARLEALQAAADADVRKVHREIRIATLLLRSLDLEPRS
jgi:hypothetical protein